MSTLGCPGLNSVSYPFAFLASVCLSLLLCFALGKTMKMWNICDTIYTDLLTCECPFRHACTHTYTNTWTYVLTCWLYCWWIGYRTCLASRQHGNPTDAQSERSIWTTTSFAAVTWQIVKIIQVIYWYEHAARKLRWGYTKIIVVNFHTSSWIHLLIMLITCVCPCSLSWVPLCLGHMSHDQGF